MRFLKKICLKKLTFVNNIKYLGSQCRSFGFGCRQIKESKINGTPLPII